MGSRTQSTENEVSLQGGWSLSPRLPGEFGEPEGPQTEAAVAPCREEPGGEGQCVPASSGADHRDPQKELKADIEKKKILDDFVK